MSFSSNTKSELSRLPINKLCCAVAEAYGVLLYCNLFNANEIRIVTSSTDFAERLPKLFKKAFSCTFDNSPSFEVKGKHCFSISSQKTICLIFDTYGYHKDSILAHHINLGMLEEPCCKDSFLRGAFFSGGSLTDPEKSYHLQMVTPHYNVSREALSILVELGLSPKCVSRDGNYTIYFKNSSSIEEFLTRLGAPISAMNIMSAKVEKDMRNTINRRVNCDSANADKVVTAAQEQLSAIKKLEQISGLQELPEKLYETALLRIANPDASLNDLAMLAQPPVSKSCISHRMKKLIELADN